MLVEVESVVPLRFTDGAPVRAASGLARLGNGLLIAQDDATHACWLRGDTATPVRVLPPVAGLDHFEEASGTKHLKPDLEAACEVGDGVLLLGSGCTPARMRAAWVTLIDGQAQSSTVDLTLLYSRVADILSLRPGELNLEGACVVDDALRWFHRGLPGAGRPTHSVDVELAALMATFEEGDPARVAADGVRTHHLETADGVGLAVTDAISVGPDLVLVSAAGEESANAYDDGPVVASALALLAGDRVVDMAALPPLDGSVAKVEGLSVLDWHSSGGRVLATVDADDPTLASSLLTLHVQDV